MTQVQVQKAIASIKKDMEKLVVKKSQGEVNDAMSKQDIQQIEAEEQVLIRSEGAAFLKLPQRTFDYLVQTGQLPASRVGKRNVRFLKSRLLQYLHEQEGVAYHRPSKAAE